MFTSKTDIYLFTICYLRDLSGKHDDTRIDKTIEEFKRLIDNHEQDLTIGARFLKGLHYNCDSLAKEEKFFLISLEDIYKSITFKQTEHERYAAPLQRRIESQLQIELFSNPTTKMTASVKAVSEKIIRALEHHKDLVNHKNIMEGFCIKLTERETEIAFGAFKKKPTIDDVITALKSTDNIDLARIMLIHFKFAQVVIRNINIGIDNEKESIGKFQEICKTNKDKIPSRLVKHIADELFYNSKLFKSHINRGRYGRLVTDKRTNTMGIMLLDQEEFNDGLPSHSNSWCPDAKHQKANLESPYVTDLSHNDAVYVSGPSGMTSLFLSQMEVLCNFKTLADKQHYLAAVAAYLVAGGFHSLHEVLGPAEYVLGLLPGYKVQPPSVEMTAPPPNYAIYYQQQTEIDSEFSKRRNDGWDKICCFYRRKFYEERLNTYSDRKTNKVSCITKYENSNSTSEVASSESATSSTVWNIAKYGFFGAVFGSSAGLVSGLIVGAVAALLYWLTAPVTIPITIAACLVAGVGAGLATGLNGGAILGVSYGYIH
ncbi:MAG: hypothetical protein CMF50_02455 [Legionellales bacterium]|nr:hypothetical protein [Legionellales bacterium]|tara:strand:+ start:41376 stop:43004 length:1629 start_codon:yes stop_codon:yes gene_type:complete